MHVTAKADYAMRAIVEISVAPDGRAKAEQIAAAQDIPLGFLRGILTDLRRAGLIVSQRSATGGFRLARPAEEITIAEVIRSGVDQLPNGQREGGLSVGLTQTQTLRSILLPQAEDLGVG